MMMSAWRRSFTSSEELVLLPPNIAFNVIRASELVLTAARASTTLGELSHVGARILAQVDSVKVVGEVLEAVVDRAVSRVKRAFRFIDEADTVRAGSVDYRARGMASLQGEHATVTAEKLVKIDGAQIHVG